MIEFSILHRSQQVEAGAQRQVECEVSAMAVEAVAKQVASFPKQAQVQAEGFLDRTSRTNRELILHVEKIELIEER